MKRNHYQILGVDFFSSRETIREAYKEAVFRFHPDKNTAPGSSEEFLAIQQAYETLGDPIKKVNYDAALSKENASLPIEIKIIYSQNPVYPSPEIQILYSLLEVNCITKQDPAVNLPLAVAMVVDTSTSMAGERLDSVKRSIFSLVKQLKPDDLLCVVAFNDHAQVVLPLKKIRDFDIESDRISRISTAGGTEMYHGMHLGLDLLDDKAAALCRKQLLIFTDGNTYGDEKECLLLARQAASRKVVITGFGFGSEWNDIFLDKLTSITGGETKFVATSQDLDQYVDEKLSEFNQLFSQSAKFAFTNRKGVRINSAFRLRPSPAPLDLEDISMLGNVRFSDKLSVLLEFGLPPNLNLSSEFRLGQGFITIESAYWESEIRKFVTFEVAFAAEKTKNPVPEEIDNALAIITMYRIQEKARQDVINGKPEQAIFKLTHLINHLTELGHDSLAKQVLIERDSIIRSGSFSRGGDKTIKYGTRALLLPEN